MAGLDPTRLSIGILLPHWTALHPETPFWWTTELPAAVPDWPTILGLATKAEQAGFDALWIVDHFQVRVDAVSSQFEGNPMPAPFDGQSSGFMECWSLLAALAATTKRVTIGPMVTCASYRNPAVLAKIAATVDAISGGRLILGLGAGDFEEEHTAFGARWDLRVSRFEEALAIVLPLLREGQVNFIGKHYRAEQCSLSPPPVSPGGPPIMIGTLAQGRRMLELVVRHADIWTGWLASSDLTLDHITPVRQTIDAACTAAGRDPATLRRSVTVGVVFGDRGIPGGNPIRGTPRQIADRLLWFHQQGIDQLNIWLNPMTDEGITKMAEVIHFCKTT